MLLMMLAAMAFAGRVYKPSELENMNVANRYDYICDPGGYLSEGERNVVNERLWNLRRQTSVEMAVAVVPSIGDMEIAQFATELFTDWGLGKSDRDNGVLLVIAIDQRKAWLQTGYGTEGALPDVTCSKILRQTVAPAMKDGNVGKAVNDATEAVCRVLYDPAFAEELRSGEGDSFELSEKVLSTDVIWKFVRILAFCAFLFALGLFVNDLRRTRGADPYHRAMTWRSHITVYWCCAVISLGAGLLFALLALWKYRRSRGGKRKCTVCGHQMRKLNEQEDNELLNAAQDLEERIGSVDYDVWKCDNCGAVDRFPFLEHQKKYTKCPSCGTVAMTLVRDHMIAPPTTRSEGIGEKEYECLFCHHKEKRRYRIPRKDDGAAAAAVLGAALGSSLGNRGGGGFGGGFGGGRTGGGGGGASW